MGNIGGFLAPIVMGRLMVLPHGDGLALGALASVLLVSALLTLLLRTDGSPPPSASPGQSPGF